LLNNNSLLQVSKFEQITGNHVHIASNKATGNHSHKLFNIKQLLLFKYLKTLFCIHKKIIFLLLFTSFFNFNLYFSSHSQIKINLISFFSKFNLLKALIIHN
jgi:hypothetical protein